MPKKDRLEKRAIRANKKTQRQAKANGGRKASSSLHCDLCNKTFARKWSKDQHDSTYHSESNTPVSKPRCWMCSLQFDQMSTLIQHYLDEHDEPTEYELRDSALEKRFSRYSKNFNAKVDPFDENANALAAICDSKHHDEIISVLNNHLQTCSPTFRAGLIINGLFQRITSPDDMSPPISMVFRTDLDLITPKTDKTDLVHKWLTVLDARLENLLTKGSGKFIRIFLDTYFLHFEFILFQGIPS